MKAKCLIGRMIELRELVGLTQSELSRIALLRRTYVGQVETRPHRSLELHRIAAIAFVCGVTLDELVHGPKAGQPLATREQVQAALEYARANPAAIIAMIRRAFGARLAASFEATRGDAKPRSPRPKAPILSDPSSSRAKPLKPRHKPQEAPSVSPPPPPSAPSPAPELGPVRRRRSGIDVPPAAIIEGNIQEAVRRRTRRASPAQEATQP